LALSHDFLFASIPVHLRLILPAPYLCACVVKFNFVMFSDDPLQHLLQTADAAALPTQPTADLPERVRRRYAQQVRTARRLKFGAAGAAMMLAIGYATSITLRQPPDPQGDVAQHLPLPLGEGRGEGAALTSNPRAEPGANSLTQSDIAKLKIQADALGVEADALEKQLNLARSEQRRQDLRDEYRRQLAINAHADAEESPIDRAAAIALCQGDYYWEQQNRQPAEAAYQSVLDNFPHSHWAEVAKERLSQFQMN
jgi:hypothetical protein